LLRRRLPCCFSAFRLWSFMYLLRCLLNVGTSGPPRPAAIPPFRLAPVGGECGFVFDTLCSCAQAL
jgi:hypothetical protein